MIACVCLSLGQWANDAASTHLASVKSVNDKLVQRVKDLETELENEKLLRRSNAATVFNSSSSADLFLKIFLICEMYADCSNQT